MRSKHPKKVFLGHFNVNSLQNRSESLNELIKDTSDIFLVSEGKLDSSFPDSQFSIPGYRIVRKSRNKNGGGILFYINEDIPFKVIKSKQLSGNLEILTSEIILNKMKVLLMRLYKLSSFSEKDFLFHLNNAYNFFYAIHENITLMDDFKMIPENEKLSDFCEMNKFEHLILKPACFKSLLPSTIDLLLTSHKQSFMGSDVYETGISDHHNKMVMSILKKTFAKDKPKTVFYRCYKSFDQDSFNETLKNRISLLNLSFENFLRYFSPR